MEQPNQSLNQSTQTAQKMKEMVYLDLEAVVKELPRHKIMKNKDNTVNELWATYVELRTNYRPFATDVFTKEKPDVAVGDIVTLQISTGNYKLRMRNKREDA